MAVLTWLALAGAGYLLLGKRGHRVPGQQEWSVAGCLVSTADGQQVAAFTAEARAFAVRRLEVSHLVCVDAGDDARVAAAYTVASEPGAPGEPPALAVLEQHFDADESVLAGLDILTTNEPKPVILAVGGDALAEYAAPGRGWLVLSSPQVPVVKHVTGDHTAGTPR